MKSAKINDDIHHAAKRRAADTKSTVETVLDGVLRPALLPNKKPAKKSK